MNSLKAGLNATASTDLDTFTLDLRGQVPDMLMNGETVTAFTQSTIGA